MRKSLALFVAIVAASASALNEFGGKRQIAKPEGDLEEEELVEVKMNPHNPDYYIEFLDPEDQPGLRNDRNLGKGCRSCCNDPECYCDYYSYSSSYCSRSSKRCERKHDDDDWWRSTSWCTCFTGKSGKTKGYCDRRDLKQDRDDRDRQRKLAEAIDADAEE